MADNHTLSTFFQTIPPSAMKQLSEMMAKVGAEGFGAEELASLVPEVYLSPDVRQISFDLSAQLKGKGLYRQEKMLVTVEENGKVEPMIPETFCTWVRDHVVTFSMDKEGKRKVQTMSKATAALIMADKTFLKALPVLRGVHSIQMPVRVKVPGESGLTEIRLLEPGYDEATGIFTVADGVKYPLDVPANKAVLRLRELFKHFPWGDDGRSLAVHIAAMLTVFCQAMIEEGDKVPMFVYNSNVPGAGKSILVKLLLDLVYGHAKTTSWAPDDKSEMKKDLDALAQELAPYLFYDDAMGQIKSTLLNQWITSETWSGRILGTPRRFEAGLRAITFMTGTGLKFREDLGRRHLLADLFPKQSAVNRKLPAGVQKISEKWAKSPEVRAELLGCLYALVRNHFDPDGERARGWEEKQIDCPIDFPGWAELIVPIVLSNGFENPLTLPELPDAGDVDRIEREKVIAQLIREELIATGKKVVQLRLHTIASVCRRVGAFLLKLGSTDDARRELEDRGNRAWPMVEITTEVWDGISPEWDTRYVKHTERKVPETEAEKELCAEQYVDNSQRMSLGWWLKASRGFVTTVDGRAFEFGSREDNVSTWVLREL